MSGEEEIVFARRASGLVRELGFQDVFLWAFAAQAASGINFYSTRMPYSVPGANAFWSFFITSAMLFWIAVATAFLATAMPRAGGPYVWTSRILNPTLGFITAWLVIIGYGVAVGLLMFITTGLIGSGLAAAGYALGNTGLVSAGEWMSSLTGRVIGGVCFCIFLWAINLVGAKAIKWLERIITYIPLVASFVCVGCFLAGAANPAANWNKVWGAGTYEAILAKAKELNPDLISANATWNWTATLASLYIPFWAYTAQDAILYVSGEVKSPEKTFKYAYIPGYLFCWFIYCLCAGATYYAYPAQFIAAYNFLFYEYPDELGKIMPVIMPSLPFFAGSVSGNVGLAAALPIFISFWFFNSCVPCYAVVTRTIFACAFDRALPEKLSEVNRFGAPTWASHVGFIWSLCGVGFAAYSVRVILGILDFTMFWPFWLYGLMALILPWFKPEIYKRCPLQYTVGGVPVISIVGALGTIFGFLAVFIGIMEFDFWAAMFAAVAIVVGLVIYMIKQAMNIKEGIDVSKIYSTLPPV